MFVLVYFLGERGGGRRRVVENAGLRVYVCVWEMFSGMPFDTEMQFPPFLYTGVLGLLEYESVALQCQGLAAPSVRSRSFALPLTRSPASAVSPAGSCIRHEGL